jgi:hypothetical protein
LMNHSWHSSPEAHWRYGQRPGALSAGVPEGFAMAV